MRTLQTLDLSTRPSVAVVCTAVCLAAVLSGCGSEPFAYAPVSGKVTYEDGSLIPTDAMVLKFQSQTPPIDSKTYPRPGIALVDGATGDFCGATTHNHNDGLVRGKHKVTVVAGNNMPLPPSVVPPEYSNPAQTPLQVDTAVQPFALRIRKPK